MKNEEIPSLIDPDTAEDEKTEEYSIPPELLETMRLEVVL